MTTRGDVVVVGAGVMGSATAWWLARRGLDVVLLERFAAGHDRGSSHGATRIFRLAYPDPAYVRMAQAALPLWRELEDDAGRTLLEVTGAVDHGDAASVGATAAALAACGATHERLDVAAAAERWPHMRVEGEVLHHPDGGRCLADATVGALHERAAHHGADVRFGVGPATVEVVDGGSGVRVRAGGDEWSAPVAVLTVGAWLPALVADGPPVPVPVPVTVTREQVQHFGPASTSWPSFIHHRSPAVYGLVGADEGLKVAEHHAGPVADPDVADQSVDAALSARIQRYVEAWFPGVDPTPLHPARCLYTTTPDHSFVLERRGPLVLGSPCSGHGFKFAPLLGRRLADLAMGSDEG